MVLDEDKAWVLWPEYFDRERSRAKGRKVTKELAVPSPSVDAIRAAVSALGLECKVEEDKSYPGNWFEKRGRVLVERSLPKSQLIPKVAEQLKKMHR